LNAVLTTIEIFNAGLKHYLGYIFQIKRGQAVRPLSVIFASIGVTFSRVAADVVDARRAFAEAPSAFPPPNWQCFAHLRHAITIHTANRSSFHFNVAQIPVVTASIISFRCLTPGTPIC
jgi:hypothetical protein